MNVERYAQQGLCLLHPRVFPDDRGFFFESYNRARFAEVVGDDVKFVQDNHSRSTKGVLRGLHYQLPPHAQGKLVRVTLGEVWDVAVDIRRGSPTFGQWQGVTLSAENKAQFWIPAGFAHGFVVLSDVAEVMYKTDDHYAASAERSIRWDDPDLAIAWPGDDTPLLSPKDEGARSFADAELFD